MTFTTTTRILSLDEAAALRPQQIVDLSRELAAARHQLDWFRRQIFGQKSERRIIDGGDGQMSLGQQINQDQVATPPSPAERPVVAHTRRSATKHADTVEDSVPFFDDTRLEVSPKTLGNWVLRVWRQLGFPACCLNHKCC
jgi:transposase